MANEPKPFQLTVRRLREILDRQQPNAVVCFVEDRPGLATTGAMRNLRLHPEQKDGTPVVKLVVSNPGDVA